MSTLPTNKKSHCTGVDTGSFNTTATHSRFASVAGTSTFQAKARI